ncbi:MAG TPA: DNA polymerase III subunit gamma/tau, partial [Nocardioides sp.]|nr:DNA polymerase III subunit gamma/tau [Nocardioides sp.]
DDPAVAAAREAIQATRSAGAEPPRSDDLARADAAVDPDDPDADAEGLEGTALLQARLGAQVIEEIPRQ